MIQIFNGDCLDLMNEIPDNSIDLILVDPPFAITSAPWDKRLPFAPMWEQFRRITKINAAMLIFAKGKFLIELAASNLKEYRYKWVWKKTSAVGYLNAKKIPMQIHEDILVFYRKLPTYNPQFTKGKPYNRKRYARSCTELYSTKKDCFTINHGTRYPVDVIANAPRYHYNQHSTNKPVDILEYLIRTYSNEGDTVLDCCMGSGSTGVACVNTNRNFVGMELNESFFEMAKNRIAEAQHERETVLFA